MIHVWFIREKQQTFHGNVMAYYKGLTDEKRCYICNIFCYWLTPYLMYLIISDVIHKPQMINICKDSESLQGLPGISQWENMSHL